jgi:hypothetical protein
MMQAFKIKAQTEFGLFYGASQIPQNQWLYGRTL